MAQHYKVSGNGILKQQRIWITLKRMYEDTHGASPEQNLDCYVSIVLFGERHNAVKASLQLV